MRRLIAAAGWLALAGCADDSGGPQVAPDARPAPSESREAAAPRPGKAISGPATPPPSPGKIGAIRP